MVEAVFSFLPQGLITEILGKLKKHRSAKGTMMHSLIFINSFTALTN
jgi:hypothetical protein